MSKPSNEKSSQLWVIDKKPSRNQELSTFNPDEEYLELSNSKSGVSGPMEIENYDSSDTLSFLTINRPFTGPFCFCNK